MEFKFDCKEENYIIKDNEKKLLILFGINIVVFGSAFIVEKYMGPLVMCKIIVMGTFLADLVIANYLKVRKKRAFKLKVVLLEKNMAMNALRKYYEEREFLLSESGRNSLKPEERKVKLKELDCFIQDAEELRARKIEQEKELKARLSIA